MGFKKTLDHLTWVIPRGYLIGGAGSPMALVLELRHLNVSKCKLYLKYKKLLEV